MSEAEPRRSVRATKGQHTKSFDDQPIEPPKKRGRKKKQQQQEEEEPEEEIIRCVCGATEQDGDSEEPWIACDKCTAWQHNVCMGMSVFSEDLPKNYYCEQCAPQDHKELLAAMEKGEKPWEQRRKDYEEEQAEGKKKKKKKGGRGAKRISDTTPKEEPVRAPSSKAGDSPAPETKPIKGKKEPNKRKPVEEPDGAVKPPAPKIRKVSAQPEVKKVNYTPPSDLPAKVTEIADSSAQSTASYLMRSVQAGFAAAAKQKLVPATKPAEVSAQVEKWAIQIEFAVRETHPDQKAYAAQCRALAANLKGNPELIAGLQQQTLSPPMLAVMTTDQLATKEQQQKNAELKANLEKQSILVTEDGPRIRRNHKGEELVENESFNQQEETRPNIRRASTLHQDTKPTQGAPQPENAAESPTIGPMRVDTQGGQQSPRQSDFDINKVFSSVKSQSPMGIDRRASSHFANSNGPGVDPDVDRLLQDDNESPPYSPTDESDPDIVWRGDLAMAGVAEFQATAKFAAGANLSNTLGISWSSVLPRRMTVAGRIDDQKAIEYLCGLRYADHTDIAVVDLTPVSEMAGPEFQKLFDYFTLKKKYAVIGDKGHGNVRDTYLVPVLPGEGNLPEFLLNFTDNLVPMKRTEPILLTVIVYRNTAQPSEQRQEASSQSPVTNTPTPTPSTHGLAQRTPSISAPAFSPTVPQGQQFHQPIQPATTHNGHPTQGAHQVVPPNRPPQGYVPPRPTDAEFQQQRERGEAIARDVLGDYINCPTVQFLLPQAYQMTRREWEICRGVYERDERARNDLRHLSQLLQHEGNAAQQANAAKNAAAQAAQAAATAPTQASAPQA